MKCKDCKYLTVDIDTCLGVEVPFDWCPKINDNPYRDKERVCEYYEPKTNIDRIRSMSDEELAKFLNSCGACSQISYCRDFDCDECIKLWLQEKVVE